MKSETAELSVSYTKVDVLQFLRFMFNLCHYGCEWMITQQLTIKHTEQEFLYTLEHAPQIFGNYQEKWAKQLASWCFSQALKEGYIYQSKVEENAYYFSEICVEKKRGRPKKEEITRTRT